MHETQYAQRRATQGLIAVLMRSRSLPREILLSVFVRTLLKEARFVRQQKNDLTMRGTLSARMCCGGALIDASCAFESTPVTDTQQPTFTLALSSIGARTRERL